MADLSTRAQFALKVFAAPFLGAGLLLGFRLHSWLFQNTHSVTSSFIGLFLGLAGAFVGGLIAYGLVIFFLTWLAPGSPLLAEHQVTPSSKLERVWMAVVYPPFRAVKAFARFLAPRRRHHP